MVSNASSAVVVRHLLIGAVSPLRASGHPRASAGPADALCILALDSRVRGNGERTLMCICVRSFWRLEIGNDVFAYGHERVFRGWVARSLDSILSNYISIG